MPKPFINLTGNGCHAHISVWDKAGKTNLSTTRRANSACRSSAYNFLGGIMQHAAALAAITNPTVNSYKRINAPRTSRARPGRRIPITYGGNNRTHMVRMPDAGPVRARLPDGAANPYLLQAAILAAGSTACEKQMRPRQAPRHRHVCRGPHGEGRQKLPLNLLDALRNFESSTAISAGAAARMPRGYLKLKHNEWNQYCRHLTQWERRHHARLLRPAGQRFSENVSLPGCWQALPAANWSSIGSIGLKLVVA